ncbi:hypothetical protein [Curtobacterium sp. MCJR17_043]|uniref:hypothetical protein n=1 Tax=Curtobacterium sp. MCJR17_043 TaxID=2175660 RepID=UPI0032E88968
MVVETSGSTGTGKRVALSSAALLAGAAAADAALGGPGGWVLALPTHYIAGLNVLTRSIVAGTTPVVVPPGHFDAGAFADAADRLEVGPAGPRRYTSLVPVQLARVLDDPPGHRGPGAVRRGAGRRAGDPPPHCPTGRAVPVSAS